MAACRGPHLIYLPLSVIAPRCLHCSLLSFTLWVSRGFQQKAHTYASCLAMLSTHQPHSLDQKTTDQRAMVPWVPWVPCPWSTFGANLQGLWHWPRCVLMQIAMINHTNWHHKYSIMCYHGIMNAEIAQNIPAVSWNSSTWTRDTWWWGFTVSSSMLSGSLLQIKSANM